MQPNLGNRRLSICGWKKSGSDKSKLMPWDLIDRMVGPIICCHAAAILLSGALNLLRISQVSALVLFILFTILTVSGVLFYHSLTRLLSLDGWPRVRLDGVLWFAFQLVVVFLARLAGGALRCRTVRLADVRVHVERAEHVDEQAGVQRQQGGDRFRVAAGRLELHLHRVEEHNDELHLEEGKWRNAEH
uniref:Uncharacterized protein n=1 Tax=Anopheles merus TaxID=30066 RepID=A0A182V8Q5_ANOME